MCPVDGEGFNFCNPPHDSSDQKQKCCYGNADDHLRLADHSCLHLPDHSPADALLRAVSHLFATTPSNVPEIAAKACPGQWHASK